MSNAFSSRFVIAAALVLVSVARAQDVERAAQPSRATLEGLVLESDGAPAAGAVVVTSAGGQAVARDDGWFRIEVELPGDATGLELAAFSSGASGRSARLGVARPTGSGSTRVGPLVLAASAGSAPSWLATFGAAPGVEQTVYCYAVFDDGAGAALYAGGFFTEAGGLPANNVARWDGAHWAPLGSGANESVLALAVFDDGGGPALYAGGTFTTAGGVSAARIARWDGTSWSAVGGGMNERVRALRVYDDGSGPALWAAGSFSLAGGATARRVARWNGTTWSEPGVGMTGGTGNFAVWDLEVFDDGSGTALYAGGDFTSAGGASANHVARWNGTSWAPLGSGLGGQALDLFPFDDGSGPALYVGGHFVTAGGVTANHIARWNGTSWSAVGSGMDYRVYALAAYDDGGGPVLFAGGQFATAGGASANNIARWDGSSWTALGDGTSVYVHVLFVHDDGSGPELFAGGGFHFAGDLTVRNAAKWNGSHWSTLGSGPDNTVLALTVGDLGDGNELFAGGRFGTVGSVGTSYIARWNGTEWSALGAGLPDWVTGIAILDDGGGPKLYATWNLFQLPVSLGRLSRWNGATWTTVGSMDGPAECLAVFDTGEGPALYVGGRFTHVGATAADRIARYKGGWSEVGGGVTSTQVSSTTGVYALTVHDDGSGPTLVAGGDFRIAGGVSANNIARWNGASWSTFGVGIGDRVYALATDDAEFPALYAGGLFTRAGAANANRVAKWDGAHWSALGTGTNAIVRALALMDDGTGRALFAAGDFTTAGGVAASRLARWNGTAWAPLGSGMSDDVAALAVFYDGDELALHAGGVGFAPDSLDSHLARWGRADTTGPVLACPPAVFAADAFTGPPGEIVDFTVTATDDQDPAPSVVCVPPSGSYFPRGTTLVTCTATDGAGNPSVCEFPVTVTLKARER